MSSEKLIIVESPTKAKTIGKMLGKNYRILSSMGHIRDLPEQSFGVDIKNNFEPKYYESKKKGNIIRQLRSEAKTATSIYLAPDADREGEAIAWHLRELLKSNTKAEFHRITFHEITRTAIVSAFEHSHQIDMNLVDAQQARRVLDRLVGYQISPLLWSKIEKGVSAGRVQSVALRLICDREREINAFVPEEFWNFVAAFSPYTQENEQVYQAKLFKIDDDKFKVDNREEAEKIVSAVKGGSDFKVESVDIKPKKKYPSPPFITSTLQQTASNYMGFNSSFTMRIAQQLYEGIDIGSGPVGLITYMRTDSVTIAAEARNACRNYISNTYGNDYVPEKPNFFKNKASAQEAHEAIRPTDVTVTPESIKDRLDDNQFKLYSLIWKRFVSSQAAPALQKQTTVLTRATGTDSRQYTFRTMATVTEFPGYLRIYSFKDNKDENNENGEVAVPDILAKLRDGDPCFLKDLLPEQKFTEPPPRFSEATLIRELESNGIGRPSTYSSIVGTIQKRLYVSRSKGKFIPTELGFKVNDYLVETLPELFQVGFTADMEAKLDQVESGEIAWTQMMQDFYDHFAKWLRKAKIAGAPEMTVVRKLTDQLNHIHTWNPPEKKGNRYFDDKRFYNSVYSKFDKDNQISEKQWNALLRMAVRYEEQLPGLDEFVRENGFEDDVRKIREEINAQELAHKQQAGNHVDSEADQELKAAFASVAKVKWDPPVKANNRLYDDGKFFASLNFQLQQGRGLSDKQKAAFKRMVVKYRDQIPEYPSMARTLMITPEEEKRGNGGKQSAEKGAGNEEIAKLLEALKSNQEWDEPVKKGRRVYDDKAFYESLEKQYSTKNALSNKQVQALKKLVSKYSKTDQ